MHMKMVWEGFVDPSFFCSTVGCSNWKRTFLVLEGRLPVPHEGEKRPSEAFLNSASKLRDLPDKEREWRLKVRH